VNDIERKFRARIANGYKWQCVVAQRISQRGIPAHVPPLIIRPDIAVREQYRDGGDIVAGRGDTIEVKSRSKVFHSVADYPWDPIFVEAAESWDRRTSLPKFFVVVSTKTGAAIACSGITVSRYHVVEPTQDHERGIDYDAVALPRAR
jgi:hypothetical protein